MKPEIKSCQNCHKDFTIETEDFNFYEKIKVPPPTWCPECRMIRRVACINSWSLFWRNCDKCGKRMMSQFSPKNNVRVFCQPCWWADDWDGTEFGMEYDPTRPFLAQLKELAERTPYNALETEYLTLKNCDYSNSIAYSKDCYLTCWADYCENVFYSSLLNGMKSSMDCLRGWESELCYETIGSNKNYRTFFSDGCGDCVDVWFSRNCYGSTNCIGCVNLRNASNCIFNVKYSKEEYDQRVKEMRLDTWSGIQELKQRADEFLLTKPYREYHGNSLNVNVSGEYVYQSRNSHECYMVNYSENCKYCQFITVASVKDSMDYSGWGNGVELAYESIGIGNGASNVKFSTLCFADVENLEYSMLCVGGKNNFGCVNLKRKTYSILNKQYSKEEYLTLKEKIIEDMNAKPYVDETGKVWTYGDFFKPGFSKFPYNKSNAMKFFPKPKEEALAMGYTWDDSEGPAYVTTIKSENLPDTIAETADEILNEVVECANCKRGYKIVQGELNLLRKMGLPVSHECPKCRENERFARMTKPGMHHRTCDKCGIDIYTPYAPEDPKIVYCVRCYQSEFA